MDQRSFESLFCGWKILEVERDRDIWIRVTEISISCKHEEGYTTTFKARLESENPDKDLIDQVSRQINLFSAAISHLPAEAVDSPEVMEDEEPEWTPDLIPELWQ